MKLKKWDWYNYIFATSIFSLGIFLLYKPWFNYFYKMRSDYLNLSQQIYFFIIVIFSAILGKLLSRIESKFNRLFSVIIFISINFFIIYYLGWPFRYFTLYFLIAIISAFRFEMYFGGSNFNRDFGLGVVFLLITLIFSSKIQLGLDFINIIIIFVSGIGLSVFFNYDNKNYRGKFKVIFASIFLAGGLSFLIALIVPESSDALSSLSSYFVATYFKLVDIFIIIIYPLIWLMGPIHRFLMFLLNKFSVGELEQPEKTMADPEMEKFFKQVREHEAANTEFGIWLFYIILGLVVIYLSFRLWKISKNDSEEGFSEERESLLTKEALKNDLNQFINKIKKPFKRNRKKSIYDESTPLLIIREVYYNFLYKYNKYKYYHNSNTPNDYLYLLLRSGYLKNKKDVSKKLTEIYNRARYKEIVKREEAEKAKKIWEEIKNE